MCTRVTGSQTLYISTLLLLLTVSLAVGPVAGDFVNYTIDDQYGDQYTGSMPVYTPSTSFAQGNNCNGCKANLNSLAVFDGTWHDATIDSVHSNTSVELTISMNFTGVALYAFCVIPNTHNYSTFANYTFSIDGDIVGSYQHIPDGSDNISYQVPVYTNTSLTNAAHEFTLHIPRGSMATLILFDYVVYTQLKVDRVTTSPAQSTATSISTAPATPALLTHNHPNTVALASGVSGGLAFLILITCAVFIYNRRQRNKAHFGHRPSFQESPPVQIETQTIVQLLAPQALRSITSFDTSEVSMNRPILERPPDYQCITGSLSHSGYIQTALPSANNWSHLDQVYHGPTEPLQQSYQPANSGFTYLHRDTDDRNFIPTVVNQSDFGTSFHRASDADDLEVQEARSRHTVGTMTDTLPPSYYTGGFEF